jgi:hypothetical protein
MLVGLAAVRARAGSDSPLHIELIHSLSTAYPRLSTAARICVVIMNTYRFAMDKRDFSYPRA